MTQHRELVRQMLEALESNPLTNFSQDAAILAAREYLAAPEQSEPVAYIAWRDGKPCWDGDDAVCKHAVWPVDSDDDRESMPVYLRPNPQPTTPEPVNQMLLKSAKYVVDVDDDYTKNAPEHRCYVPEAFSDSIEKLRTAISAAEQAPQPAGLNYEELLGAIARGWCTPINERKVMDSDLAIAIAEEVVKYLAAAQRKETK